MLSEAVEAGLKAAAEEGERDVVNKFLPYFHAIGEDCWIFLQRMR